MSAVRTAPSMLWAPPGAGRQGTGGVGTRAPLGRRGRRKLEIDLDRWHHIAPLDHDFHDPGLAQPSLPSPDDRIQKVGGAEIYPSSPEGSDRLGDEPMP